MNEATATDLLHQAIQAEQRGRFAEARDLLRQAACTTAPLFCLDAQLRLGKLCLRGGTPADYAEAETVLSEARAQAEHQGARRQAAVAIHLLALLHYQRRQLDAAQRLLEQSPALKQDAALGPETAQLFHYRGLLAAARQDLPNAEQLCFRAYQVYREVHHDAGLAEVSDTLANLLLKRGKTRAALRFADLSLQRKRSLQDRFGEAISLGTKGRIELQLARYEEARQAFAADLALARELGDERGVGIVLNSLGEVALLRKDAAAAEEHFRDSLAGERGPINAFFAEAGLVRVYLATGRLEDAAAGCLRLVQRQTRSFPTTAGRE